MACRLRIPRRAQLTAPLSCPQTTSYSRSFTLSAKLAASKRTARTTQPISLRPQQSSQPPLPPTSPPPSSSSSPKAEPLADLLKHKKWPLFGAGIAALCAGLYLSLVITSTLKDNKNDRNQQPTPYPSSSSCLHDHPQPPPTGLPSTLDTTTPTTAATTALAFDKSLNYPEWLMGITSLRKTLASRARGHVLEVAVGTGRNLAYYDWAEVVSLSQDEDEARAARERERVVRLLDAHRPGGPTLKEQRERGEGVGSLEGEVLSFTGVDVNGDMLGVARDRIREAVPGLVRLMRKRRLEGMPRLEVADVGEEGVPVVDALDGRVRLVLGDAVRGLPSPPSLPPHPPGSPAAAAAAAAQSPPTKYDTIIQTFGLCSVADPARLLANMAARVQPDSGRIVLLEHGRGTYEWMNGRLDKSAPKHFRKFGCWWNRDIEQIVRDAAAEVPGLEVVNLERPLWFQWGTTLLIELKVNSRGGDGFDRV